MANNSASESGPNKVFLGLLVLVGSGLALLALLIPTLSRALSPPPQPGDVATQDYRAPEPITYDSEVLTEQRREVAERAVLPIYTSTGTIVARTQLERLRNSLTYITSVRADEYATPQEKKNDLAALSDVQLSPDTADAVLGLTDTRWQAIQQEAIIVLERVMRSAIRPERLDGARASVPALVSLSLPEAQADIVAELASAFIAPNSEYSEALTEAARQDARDSVTPVSRSYAVGQTVALRGQILGESDVEALEQLKLIQPQPKWQNLLSAVVIVLLITVITALYLSRQKALSPQFGRSITMIVVLFLVTLFSARLTIPSHTVIPYAFPVAAYGLTVAALFGAELAMITAVPLAILVAFGLPNALDLTLYYILGSLFGVLALGRARRIVSFFKSGAAVAFAGSIVILAYQLPLPTTDWLGVATLTGAAIFNGLASASIALLLQFFLAQFLDMTTPMQLMDLTRPDHPLVQRLLNTAPGTYQHSLQVANMAEQAAERIDADPLLTRVGALYHDVGKLRNPIFFIENQPPGFPNPHDKLDPLTSSAAIIRHVPDGLDLARKYRLPGRIVDFIAEHHGTMVTRYQYVNALKAAGGDEEIVEEDQFRYPGPRPQSRETAIVMLADGSEARVRAERPVDEDELRKLIQGVVEDRVTWNQMDDTDLTLRELNVIVDSFTGTLKGVYHPRVKYPQLSKDASLEPVTTPLTNRISEGDSDVQVDMSVDTPSSVP